jgi:small GTP-binding protein
MIAELIRPGGKPVKLKICMVGELAVGKTCLIRRYVYDEFDDKYCTTIGTKTVKKEIKARHPKEDGYVDVHMIIWDIMGSKSFRQLLQEAYFNGLQGIIGVCDNTRENTLSDLHDWMDLGLSCSDDVSAVFLGNKCDLEEDQEIGLSELKSFSSTYERTEPYLSSAKTGKNVERAFKTLCEKILKDMLY